MCVCVCVLYDSMYFLFPNTKLEPRDVDQLHPTVTCLVYLKTEQAQGFETSTGVENRSMARY